MESNLKVTYILLVFNQSKYVKDAVLSALNQNYENIEFIFSDDASSDNSFEIIRSSVGDYLNNKKIILNKNEKNLGLVSHVNKCLEMATGDIICLAAGDDISIEDRVRKTVKYFSNIPNITALSFNDNLFINDLNVTKKLVDINQDKIFSLVDFLNMKPFPGASRAFHRKVYDFFGPLSLNAQTEDSTFLLRSLLLGKCVLSNSPGIFYRWHGENISNKTNIVRFNIDGIFNQYIVDIEKALDAGLLDQEKYNIILNEIKVMKKIRNFFTERSKSKKIINGFLLFLCSNKFRLIILRKVKKIIF